MKRNYLLLGLLKEDQSLARRFLGSPWALDNVWGQVSQSIGVWEKSVDLGDLKLSSVSKRVLVFAATEAELLSNRHIGTEHLLLGMLREEKCFAAQMLHQRGVRLGVAREELARTRHDDSVHEEFVREGSSLPDRVANTTQVTYGPHKGGYCPTQLREGACLLERRAPSA